MHLAGFNDFKFSHRGQFDAEHVLKINDKTYFTPKEIFELIEPNVHHAWRDNYKYWNQHGQLNEFGKLFPINKPSMTEEDITLPIFFDDNVFDEVCPEEGIIAVKSIDESYKPVFEELRQREQIVHVNPLKALSDKSYFIHKIIQAIAYYSLKSKQVAETLQNELIQNDLVSSGMPNENTSHFLSFKRSKAEPELQNSVQAVDEDKKQKILM